MEKIILCKYGEIALKGANRRYFETQLGKELVRVTRPYGRFCVTHAQNTSMIRPLSDACDLDGAYAAVKRVFGIVAVSIAYGVEKNMDAVLQGLRTLAPQLLADVRHLRWRRNARIRRLR